MPEESAANNKRIAKNTMFLYIRQIMVLIVGLYTVRIVLNVLGEADYGIYNVVGGIVTMMAFLNSGMIAASQRFMAFEIGKKDTEKLKKVFAISALVHVFIAIFIFIIAETVGLWFVNTQLNIASERMYAANWVYQCSVFTFIISIISIPYSSCIIAHEQMKVYAYVSIVEALTKLGVAFLLFVSPIDTLILYSILLLFIQILIRCLYTIYCKKHFEESTFRYIWDKDLFKDLFSFASWSIVGNLGFSFKDQGSNIILNIFFGPTINAARSIALQISHCINSFSNNFAIALTPQITKQYASGNYEESRNLVYLGSRYSFFLMSLISIPFLINIDYTLQLWLKDVPEYTSIFVELTLMASLMYAMTQPITNAIQATGNIKWFQISLAILLLLELPIAWIILKLGGKPYMAVLPTIFTNFLSIYLRIIILKKLVVGYSIRTFTFDVILRCFAIFILCWGISYYIRTLFEETLLGFVVTIFFALCVSFITIFIFGIKKQEKEILVEKARQLIKKYKTSE